VERLSVQFVQLAEHRVRGRHHAADALQERLRQRPQQRARIVGLDSFQTARGTVCALCALLDKCRFPGLRRVVTVQQTSTKN
jgi:hypothetical protein